MKRNLENFGPTKLLLRQICVIYAMKISEKIVTQATEVRHLFKERFSKIWEIVHPFLQTSNKDIRLCDRNMTDLFSGLFSIFIHLLPLFIISFDILDYPQITNFLHRFVDNEINLNEESSCTQSCSDFKQSRHYQCFEGTLCNPCEGTVRECEDSSVEVHEHILTHKL